MTCTGCTDPIEVHARFPETGKNILRKPDVRHSRVLFPTTLEALLHVRSFSTGFFDVLIIIEMLHHFLDTGCRVTWKSRSAFAPTAHCVYQHTPMVSPRWWVWCELFLIHGEGKKALGLTVRSHEGIETDERQCCIPTHPFKHRLRFLRRNAMIYQVYKSYTLERIENGLSYIFSG